MALSPMMEHWQKIKEAYPDCLVFYRLGDFYEMFFEDAEKASRILDLTLTGRDCGLKERAPMCGVPYHAVDAYIQKLVENGQRVAICEQLSDPKASKGMVDRDVIRVVSGRFSTRRRATILPAPSKRGKSSPSHGRILRRGNSPPPRRRVRKSSSPTSSTSLSPRSSATTPS